MKNDLTIEQMIAELDERMIWFQGEDFKLDDAKQKFIEVKKLAESIERALTKMQNEVEVLAKDFGEA